MNQNKFNKLLLKIKFDKKALKEIYNFYYALIVIHINCRFRNKVEAKDIAQQVFIKLIYMNITEYIVYPTSWIYRIAENTALEVLRKDNKRKIAENESAVKKSYENELDREVHDKEILNCLDSESKIIVYLHYWERYRLKEIAIMQNINYSTLKSRHKKAKLILKKHINKEKKNDEKINGIGVD